MPSGASGSSDRGNEVGKSFADQVAAEGPGLYRYAVSLVGNRQDAEDLVHDTVVRALEKRQQLQDLTSLRTWLHRILHRIAIDHARHVSFETVVPELEALPPDRAPTNPSTLIERREAQEDLREALLHLPFAYRTVVVLHDAEGWTVPEIAESLNIGLPAAKQRLRRGRSMLVDLLAHQDERHAANRGVALSCRQARRQISDYMDDALEPGQRALLEAHLEACATCPPLYTSLVGIRSSLGRLHDPDSVIPPTLAQRIRAKVDQASSHEAGYGSG